MLLFAHTRLFVHVEVCSFAAALFLFLFLFRFTQLTICTSTIISLVMYSPGARRPYYLSHSGSSITAVTEVVVLAFFENNTYSHVDIHTLWRFRKSCTFFFSVAPLFLFSFLFYLFLIRNIIYIDLTVMEHDVRSSGNYQGTCQVYHASDILGSGLGDRLWVFIRITCLARSAGDAWGVARDARVLDSRHTDILNDPRGRYQYPSRLLLLANRASL